MSEESKMTEHVQFYLTPEQYRILVKISEFYGVRPNQAARKLVENKLYTEKIKENIDD